MSWQNNTIYNTIHVHILSLHWYCKKAFCFKAFSSKNKTKFKNLFEKPTKKWQRTCLCGMRIWSWPWVCLWPQEDGPGMSSASVNKKGGNIGQMQWRVLGTHPLLRNSMVLCHKKSPCWIKVLLLKIYFFSNIPTLLRLFYTINLSLSLTTGG